ncbi:hypothetical protein [Sinorhizobium alkalisoli]|nr:hypothetical protein [Sinorhizobium alkalisoli]MCA1491816.1 hypothetical protein [Ensifer sp. NBAIM29]MCG5480308.1 hypothetical protein [Sinorhizobium alkalisoli]
MDKAGIAFVALILVLISLVGSILVVDQAALDAPKYRQALVPTKAPYR